MDSFAKTVYENKKNTVPFDLKHEIQYCADSFHLLSYIHKVYNYRLCVCNFYTNGFKYRID
jgi:hypothetical protein